MTDTIKRYYEYAEDSLSNSSACGTPKGIVYIQYKYVTRLSKFLSNYDMKFPVKKNTGNHFRIIHFTLKNLSALDCFNDNNNQGKFKCFWRGSSLSDFYILGCYIL